MRILELSSEVEISAFLKGKLWFLNDTPVGILAIAPVWEAAGGALGDNGDPTRSQREILGGPGVLSGPKMRARGSKK